MSDFNDVASLLPHEAPMILIDKLVTADELTVHCQVHISENSPFFDSTTQSVGGWVGIEYMAQTIGVWSGYHNRLKGKASPVGFLLGSRRYQSQQAKFSNGVVLDIFADQLMESEGMSAFACEIKCDEKLLASSQLNVFVPTTEQLQKMLEESK